MYLNCSNPQTASIWGEMVGVENVFMEDYKVSVLLGPYHIKEGLSCNHSIKARSAMATGDRCSYWQ